MKAVKILPTVSFTFAGLSRKASVEERTKRANDILEVDFPKLDIMLPGDNEFLYPYPILTGVFDVSKRDILKALLKQLSETLFPAQPIMISRVREVAGSPELRMVMSPYECQ